MANTGYAWSAYAATQKGAGDWTADALADNATETSDAIDATGKVSGIFSVSLVEDNTGAIDGNVTISIWHDYDGTNFQLATDPVFSFTVLPVQNLTVTKVFSLDMSDFDVFKISILNESGQELAVTVKQKFADIPVASA